MRNERSPAIAELAWPTPMRMPSLLRPAPLPAAAALRGEATGYFCPSLRCSGRARRAPRRCRRSRAPRRGDPQAPLAAGCPRMEPVDLPEGGETRGIGPGWAMLLWIPVGGDGKGGGCAGESGAAKRGGCVSPVHRPLVLRGPPLSLDMGWGVPGARLVTPATSPGSPLVLQGPPLSLDMGWGVSRARLVTPATIPGSPLVLQGPPPSLDMGWGGPWGEAGDPSHLTGQSLGSAGTPLSLDMGWGGSLGRGW